MTKTHISQLITQCANGDRSALTSIYEDEASRLLGLINTIVRNKAVAEDILHDLFVKLWMQADKFDAKDGNGSAWLSRMARNLALNAVRYKWRESSLSEEATSVELESLESLITDNNTEQLLTGESHQLQHCLEQIEPEPRAAIINAYVNGLSHAELTKQLSAPLGTIKAWIKRSVHKLKECMS